MTILVSLLIASTATSCLYWLFYHLSPFIWSGASAFPANDYMPGLRGGIQEQNGIQTYALFALMFLNLGFSFMLNAVFLSIKDPFLRLRLLAFPLVIAFIFFGSIGFYAPVATPTLLWPWVSFVGAVFLITLFLALNDKAPWMPFFLFAALFFICLITSSTQIGKEDYSFILSPAWRLLHGFGLKGSFFLYDYFLSMVSALWIKFFPVETVPMLASFSFFALFFGTYLFAKRFFNNKQLAVYLLISLVLIKVYIDPMNYFFQATPLRLDWWIVLAALAYWKTPDHWSVAACLSFLIVFHHLFGIIYAVCYFIFVLVLIGLDIFAGKNSMRDIFKKYSLLYFKNFILVVLAFLLYKALLQPSVDIVLFYQKNNLGSMPISPHSFYWYMPFIFASAFLLLCKNRPLLAPKYFQTSILIFSLVIGSSMYFFRRGHENNITFVAAGLLMVLFLLLDLVHVELKQVSSSKFIRWIVPLAATMVVLIISYQYDYRAMGMFGQQVFNIKNNLYIPSPYMDIKNLDFQALKAATFSSPKVIFIDQKDFYFYDAGKYPVPRGYYCSWFFLKDYVQYLNEQLDKGYYIVVPRQDIPNYSDIMTALKARYFTDTADFSIFANSPLNH